MYSVSAQGIVRRVINARYYYYYYPELNWTDKIDLRPLFARTGHIIIDVVRPSGLMRTTNIARRLIFGFDVSWDGWWGQSGYGRSLPHVEHTYVGRQFSRGAGSSVWLCVAHDVFSAPQQIFLPGKYGGPWSWQRARRKGEPCAWFSPRVGVNVEGQRMRLTSR